MRITRRALFYALLALGMGLPHLASAQQESLVWLADQSTTYGYLPAGRLMVAPTGGAPETLANALAAAATGGVTPGTANQIATYTATGKMVAGGITPGTNIATALASALNGSGALVGSTGAVLNPTSIGATQPGSVAATTLNSSAAATLASVTSNVVNSSTTSNVVNFKNGPNGASMLQVGGANANVAVQTQLQLFGRAWTGSSISANANIFENSTWTGAPGGNITANLGLLLTNENIDVGASGELDALEIHNITTAGFTGNRHGLMVIQDVTGAASGASNATWTGINAKVNLTANQGGTGLTPSTAMGLIYGDNPVAHLAPGATFIKEIVGSEVDTWAESGSSVLDKIGMQIVDITGSVTHGARDDVALSLNNNYSPTSALGFATGLEFGRGGGNFPVTTTGTMIYAQDAGSPFTVANGIDFHLGTATNKWVQYGSVYSIDGSGNEIANSVAVGSKTTLTTAGQVQMSKITASGTAPGVGVMKLEVVAGTNAGTCKLISYAGTSTTPVTVVDNVGTGC